MIFLPPNIRCAHLGMATLFAFTLAGCDADRAADPVSRAEAEAAHSRWVSACPIAAEDEELATERAYAGDIEAIDCRILSLRSLALFADMREAQGAYDEYADYVPGEMAEGLRRMELAHLYVRWRLTGESWEELAALAPTMTKDDIEFALYLSGFDEGLLPRRDIDACGRTAETDPRYQVIQLGTGDRAPPTCDREF